eukprot:COSAG01_NODE_258_length_20077_cov_124.162429_30_plen_80_part_00
MQAGRGGCTLLPALARLSTVGLPLPRRRSWARRLAAARARARRARGVSICPCLLRVPLRRSRVIGVGGVLQLVEVSRSP